MLRLMRSVEGSIRRSSNARLHIETLLVQWTMLDRTVELSEVLQALEQEHGIAKAAGSVTSPGQRAANEDNTGSAERARSAVSRGGGSGQFSLNAVREAWDTILELVGRQRRLAREALAHASPVAVADGVVILEVSDSEVHLEGLKRSRRVIEQAIGEVVGTGSVRVKYRGAANSGNDGDGSQVRRLDHKQQQRERLLTYRERSSALDAIADALDLEVIE
jgi:hypothetical protein